MIVRRPTDSTRHAIVHISDYDGAITCACGRVFKRWEWTDNAEAARLHVQSWASWRGLQKEEFSE